MVAFIPLLIALLGLLLYVLSSNGKVQQLGYALFCIGMLVFTLGIGNRAVKLL